MEGQVTSRYSRVGLNTVPPWSFCSRSFFGLMLVFALGFEGEKR